MRAWSLAQQLFVLQAIVVAVVLLGVGVAAYLQVDQREHDTTAEQMLAVAHTLADVPDVRAAIASPDPTARLQPLAEQVRRDTGTDFVVVMTVDGLRFTHPDTTQIGKHYLGTIAPAANGESITETYTGTLGPSVRAVVPVRDGTQVVALVAVGRTVEAVSRALTPQIFTVLGAVAVALALAAGGSFLVSRWLRRTTRDLGPAELARRNEYYDAVLHAVREGMVLLDLPDEAVGVPVDALGLPVALGEALASGEVRSDEIHLTAERIVVVNQQQARWDGRRLGTVVTLRDHTELRGLVSELATVRGFADSLNAQAHEAANQLHTVISLIELGRADEALEFATAELTVAQHITDSVLAAIGVPELAALVVAKVAEAGEQGVDLRLAPDSHIPDGLADARDLVTIVGNLIDNAIDVAKASPAPRWVSLGGRVAGERAVLRVADSGPGLDPATAERAFTRGWSTKEARDGRPRGLGLALVGRAVHRAGGTVGVERGDPGAVFVVTLPVRERV